MKKILLAALVAATPFAANAAPENFTLDPTHTYPHFAVDHLGVSTMWGRFGKTTGKFMLDKVAKKASIELVVETASIDTGDNVRGNRPRSRDEHLRAADFFNVQEFPTMTYKSTNVKFAGENPSEIEGQLTLLGVTKPLALKVDRWVCKDNPNNKQPMCGGNASGSFKRSDFGMKFAIPNVGDEVKLFIEVEGFKD